MQGDQLSRFLIGYLRGVRDYNDAFARNQGRAEVVRILTEQTSVRDPALYERMNMPSLDPDGTINPDNNTSVGGIEALDSADGIVMALRFRQWPDAAMRHFAAAVARGIPIIGLRTSTHAFRFPADSPSAYKRFNDFGREVLGENWVSHWGANRRGATRGVIEPGAEHHPILRGVSDVKIPTVITLIAYWGIALPVGYLVGVRGPFGGQGVWMGIASGLAFAAVFLTVRFARLTRG